MNLFGIFIFLIKGVMKIPFYLPFISYWLFNCPRLTNAALYSAFYLLFFVLPFVPSLLFLALTCLVIPPKNITFMGMASVLLSDAAASFLRAAEPASGRLELLWKRLSSHPSFISVCRSVFTVVVVSFVMLRFNCIHHLLCVILYHATVTSLAPLGSIKRLRMRVEKMGLDSFIVGTVEREKRAVGRRKKNQTRRLILGGGVFVSVNGRTKSRHEKMKSPASHDESEQKPAPSASGSQETSPGLICSSEQVENDESCKVEPSTSSISEPRDVDDNGEKSSAAAKMDLEPSTGEQGQQDECEKKQPKPSEELDHVEPSLGENSSTDSDHVKPSLGENPCTDSAPSGAEKVGCEEKPSTADNEPCAGLMSANSVKEEEGEKPSAASITLGEWFHRDAENNIEVC